MFGTKCQWEMVFDRGDQLGTEFITQMVAHLQALPISKTDLPGGISDKLEDQSWEDSIEGTPVIRIDTSYFQTGGGGVSAAVEYYAPGDETPFRARGYQLACDPRSNWGWWVSLATIGIAAFALGRIQ